VSLKSSFIQGRVAFFFSLTTGSNLVSILKFSGINALKNQVLIIFLCLVWFFFWINYFSKAMVQNRISQRFGDETFLHKLLGGIGVVIYIIVSFLAFLKTMIDY
jgi:amino acid transporter